MLTRMICKQQWLCSVPGRLGGMQSMITCKLRRLDMRVCVLIWGTMKEIIQTDSSWQPNIQTAARHYDSTGQKNNHSQGDLPCLFGSICSLHWVTVLPLSHHVQLKWRWKRKWIDNWEPQCWKWIGNLHILFSKDKTQRSNDKLGSCAAALFRHYVLPYSSIIIVLRKEVGGPVPLIKLCDQCNLISFESLSLNRLRPFHWVCWVFG